MVKDRKSVSFDLPPEDNSRIRASCKGRRSWVVDDDEAQRRLREEKEIAETKDQILKDMRESQRQVGRKSIRINNVDVSLADLNLQKLTEEQAKDIKDIEELQKRVNDMS